MNCSIRRSFSSINTKVAVVGAGPAGISFASQLARSGAIDSRQITVFDPKTEHHYQPAYTMVGGGVIGVLAVFGRPIIVGNLCDLESRQGGIC